MPVAFAATRQVVSKPMFVKKKCFGRNFILLGNVVQARPAEFTYLWTQAKLITGTSKCIEISELFGSRHKPEHFAKMIKKVFTFRRRAKKSSICEQDTPKYIETKTIFFGPSHVKSSLP